MIFSIIMPVYNTEKYINEAIESLINQTIGFEKHVELIIVNDGSTDNSEHICLEYKKIYPNNIKYIYTQNNGPAKARNLALQNISKTIKYVGFVDSDDRLNFDALEKINLFFLKHQEDTELAVLPFEFFDNKRGHHKLNYRFKSGTRIINILKEYENIHFYIGGTFLKKKVIENYKFDESLKFWEDALFINKLLLKNKKYGVISDTKYYYRKRNNNTSLVNSMWLKKERYTAHLKRAYLEIIKNSISQYGMIIPYVQYLIVYHMKLYLFQKNNEYIFQVLDKDERAEFFKAFIKILEYIDDEYILNQDMKLYYKEFLISIKHNGLSNDIERFENKYINHDLYIYSTKNRIIEKLSSKNVSVTHKSISGMNLIIEGNFVNDLYDMKKHDRLFIKFIWKKYYAEQIQIYKEIKIWNRVVRNFKYGGFKISIPIYALVIKFGIETEEGEIILNKVNCFQKLIEYIFVKLKSKLKY